MKIDWNHVTKFSQLIAIILFIAVFGLGFWLGEDYEYHAFINALHANPLGAYAPVPVPNPNINLPGGHTTSTK